MMLKSNYRTLILVACMSLYGCSDSSDSDNGEIPPDDGGISLEPVREIRTLNDFINTVVGKTAILRAEDGSRDETTQAIIRADGKVTGFTPSGTLLYNWYWEDRYYCRSGVSGLPDNSITLELNCQTVNIDNGVITFIRDRGESEISSSWFLEQLSPTRDIITSEEFIISIVGRNGVLLKEDGTKDESTQGIINADGTVTGFAPDGTYLLNWYWEDRYYCRSGVTGMPDNSANFELDCAAVRIDNNIVTNIGNRGTSNQSTSWLLE